MRRAVAEYAVLNERTTTKSGITRCDGDVIAVEMQERSRKREREIKELEGILTERIKKNSSKGSVIIGERKLSRYFPRNLSRCDNFQLSGLKINDGNFLNAFNICNITYRIFLEFFNLGVRHEFGVNAHWGNIEEGNYISS